VKKEGGLGDKGDHFAEESCEKEKVTSGRGLSRETNQRKGGRRYLPSGDRTQSESHGYHFCKKNERFHQYERGPNNKTERRKHEASHQDN